MIQVTKTDAGQFIVDETIGNNAILVTPEEARELRDELIKLLK